MKLTSESGLMSYISEQGSSGHNCGPLVRPGITPYAEPRKGELNKKEYEKQIKKWRAGYEEWKDISCPCRMGYFNEDGVWISGGEVRANLKPSNPRWAKNKGRAPRYKGDKFMSVKEIQERLFERDQDVSKGDESEQ
jgi:hypothetical protein